MLVRGGFSQHKSLPGLNPAVDKCYSVLISVNSKHLRFR